MLDANSLRKMNPSAEYGKKAKPKERVVCRKKPPSQDKLDNVLDILGDKGELSRAHLSGLSGYDVSTISKIILHLGDKVTRRKAGKEVYFRLPC